MVRFYGAAMARLTTRALVAVAALGFVVAAVWLLWADRGTILGDRIMTYGLDLGRWAERTTSLDVIDRQDVPARSDQIGHAILWMTGTVLIGSLRLLRRPLSIVGLELATLSLISEFAQPLVSVRRGFEPGDALANLVGVGIGTAVLAAFLLTQNTLRLLRMQR